MQKAQNIIQRIETDERLDAPANAVANTAGKLLGRGRIPQVLRGDWLGEPLHPPLTDMTIGALTSAVLLDLFGGERAQHGATLLVGIGALSGLPTAAAGLNDWLGTKGRTRRIGLVHAGANTVGLLLFGLSLVARLNGNRAGGASLARWGYGSLTAGAYLGGHLSYVKGVRVGD